jgi:RES domain-containing protein
MDVFRLQRNKFGKNLTGIGSAMKGARWNSIGVELIYTSSNRSLAMAEIAVHFTLATLPKDYSMLTIFIPDDISILKLKLKDLPNNWNLFPHPNTTQFIGDKFSSEKKYCVLQVPSVVTQGDFNYLINPFHKDFSKISVTKTEGFLFDKRIFKD